MHKKSGSFIAIIIWVIWLTTQEGKKVFPEVLGSWWFQWSSATIIAILIPVGTLIALRRFSCPEHRRSGLSLLIGCTTPLLCNLTAFGVLGPMGASTLISLSSMQNEFDGKMIAKCTHQALEGKTFVNRKKAAWALYTLFGVQCAWRDSSGELTIYRPSAEDEAAWLESKEINSKSASLTATFHAQLKQFPRLFALNFGCFILILFAGLIWQTFQKRESPRVT